MSSRPRVLHVYKDVHPEVPGGIERHIDALRRSVTAYESAVLVARRGLNATRVRQNDHGPEVAVWQLGRALSTPLTPAYFRWIRRLRPDLIHLHLPNPVSELAVVTTGRRVPLVATYHADIVRQAALMPAYGPLVKRVLDQAHTIISGTEALRRTSPLLDGHRERISVIPYAVDADRFTPPAAGRPPRARPKIIATGRLVYYKGFDRLIALAPRLEADLQIVGSGPLEAELRALAAVHPNVEIAGGVSDDELVRRLQAADLFVLASTSRAESFGIATIEAQATGLPAVVTDVGTGTVEAIRPGETGLVVPQADDEALLDAINSLARDAERRITMGAAARRWAIERFSEPSLAAAHEAIYAEALSQV